FALHWPGERYLEPISGVRDLIDEPMLVLYDPDVNLPFATARWNDQAYRIDFGAAVGDTSAWTFPHPQEPWLHVSPEETMATVWGAGLDTRAVLLAPTGSVAERAYRVYSDDQDGYLVAGGMLAAGMAATSAE